MALHQGQIRLVTLSFVFLGVVFLVFALFWDSPPQLPPLQTMKSWQEADAPLGYPVEVTEESKGRVPEFDPRFVLMDAYERFAVPEARQFDAPLGSESGALSMKEAKFGEKDGEQVFLGERLGGIGGGDTDFGDPVRAVGNGLVVFAGEGGEDWGKVVMVAHRLLDGRILQSVYSSLHRIDVPQGGLVSRGQVLGTVGASGEGTSAQLHFEFRETDGIEIGSKLAVNERNRLDPTTVLSHHRSGEVTGLSPEPLAFHGRPNWEGRVILKNPDKALELFGGD